MQAHRLRSRARRTSAAFRGLFRQESGSLCIEGFEDELSCYDIAIESVDFDGSDAAVVVTLTRNNDSAIIEDGVLTLFVDGSEVDSESGISPTSFGADHTLSGPASSGQSIEVRFATEAWDGEETVESTVPSGPDDGNGENGNGNGNGDGNGNGNGNGDGENGNGNGNGDGGIGLGVGAVALAAAALYVISRRS